MDVSERYSIAYKGLKTGTHDFAFKVGKALFEAFESPEIRDGDCDAAVTLVRSETMLELTVAITGNVTVACDRCLEDCLIPIDFEGQLLVKFSDEIREYDGEVLWLSPAESQVDLAQYIYESIVLALPYRRVHPEGACDPEMLGRFRIVSDEEFSAIEAAAFPAERGTIAHEEQAKLEALKRRMEEAAPEKTENK